MTKTKNKNMVGWREWVSLPELGITHIKAKIDTGAKTSALHAFDVKVEENDNKRWARFKIHPHQRNTKIVVECLSEIIDERNVMDSGGHQEKRLVIQTPISIGDKTLNCEFTLTDRDTMKFRLLIGRTALKPYFMVDPEKSYLTKPDFKVKEAQ